MHMWESRGEQGLENREEFTGMLRTLGQWKELGEEQEYCTVL